jgi:hypothetical protein
MSRKKPVELKGANERYRDRVVNSPGYHKKIPHAGLGWARS